jgi:hypothetical protein
MSGKPIPILMNRPELLQKNSAALPGNWSTTEKVRGKTGRILEEQRLKCVIRRQAMFFPKTLGTRTQGEVGGTI